MYRGASLIRNIPPLLGPPYDPGCNPTVGFLEGGGSYGRGNPVVIVGTGGMSAEEECSRAPAGLVRPPSIHPKG